MYRALKILLWTTFLFCFTFSGLVWTKPLTNFDHTDSELTALSAAPKEIKQERTAQPPTAPQPAILFLLGTGLIGLVAISRNKLFH